MEFDALQQVLKQYSKFVNEQKFMKINGYFSLMHGRTIELNI